MDDMYIGKLLDGRYEILERIGSGGMAIVYKALDHRLNRFVAIKILKSDLAQDPDLRRRFHAESQAVAMLSHPNIVSVYDVGHSESADYIVMELIEGITLKQYINRKGIVNWKEALHFTTQIAKALEHAHSRGIIHRDIKPHNIMILKNGNVKVADFGIARLLTTQNTLTKQTLGSVHYISPEQAKGGAADARSDLYSVGVVMYEMLTSRLPFEGENPVSIAIQHISSVPLQPREINPDIPVGLEEITMRAMDPNINTRYQSASELIADLEDFRKNPSMRFNYSTVPSMADDMDSTRAVPTVRNVSEAEHIRRHVSGNGATRNRVRPEEYRENRRRAGRTTMLVGIFCVAILLILLVWAMWEYALRDWLMPEQEERIGVPNFVAKMYEEVINNEDYTRYFRFEPPTYDYSSDFPEGYIISQDPTVGRQVTVSDDKIPITLTIAAGKKEIRMPYVINKDYRDAKNLLEGMGFKVNLDPEPHDTYTPDYVFQQYPAEDTILTEGMEIYLTYSTGPEIPMVPVPDLMNLTEATAMQKLESLGLVGKKVEEFNPDATKGRVFQQSIDKNVEVPQGTEVTFYISLGPEPVDEPPENTDPGEIGGYVGDNDDGSGQTTPPPEDGGDAAVPPDDGGGTAVPPEDGGDTAVPPEDGGTTVPEDGGDAQAPGDGGAGEGDDDEGEGIRPSG